MDTYGTYGAQGGRPSLWGKSLAPLRSQPGVWHRVAGFHAPSVASYIARGLASGVEAGDFEATTRREVGGEHAPTGKAFLFVRYVGGEEYPEPEPEPVEDPYRGLGARWWRVDGTGTVLYGIPVDPVRSLGYSVLPWAEAWERVGLPCPGPEPERGSLPPEDERVSSF